MLEHYLVPDKNKTERLKVSKLDSDTRPLFKTESDLVISFLVISSFSLGSIEWDIPTITNELTHSKSGAFRLPRVRGKDAPINPV